MNRAPLIMFSVSAASAVGAAVVFTRPGASERAVYGRRITGTMLAALAVILASFAYGLASAGGAS